MLGSGGPGGRGGGVVGHGGKGPLLLLRARNSDAAPGSVGPGMLTERSQCQGQPNERNSASTGISPPLASNWATFSTSYVDHDTVT